MYKEHPWIFISETQTQWGGRPLGAPPKAASVFLIILYHKYLWVFLIHSLYIPYICIYIYIYFLDMFHIFALVCIAFGGPPLGLCF